MLRRPLSRRTMNVLRFLSALEYRIVQFMAIAAGLLILFMMLAICYEVVMRYLLFRPPAWVTEVTEYILLYCTFLGSPWLLRENGHVRVDVVTSRLAPGKRRFMSVVTSVMGLCVCLVLFYFSAATTLDLYTRGLPVIKTLSVPKFLLVGIIPVGTFFLAIEFVRKILESLSEPVEEDGSKSSA